VLATPFTRELECQPSRDDRSGRQDLVEHLPVDTHGAPGHSRCSGGLAAGPKPFAQARPAVARRVAALVISPARDPSSDIDVSRTDAAHCNTF
jgi:hypothetical protein